MPDIRSLTSPLPPEPETLEVAFREAEIVSNPADATEGVMVVIPSFSPILEHGPCPWSPRIIDGSNYGIPTKGDRALVVISEEKEPWIVEWWPYA